MNQYFIQKFIVGKNNLTFILIFKIRYLINQIKNNFNIDAQEID